MGKIHGWAVLRVAHRLDEDARSAHLDIRVLHVVDDNDKACDLVFKLLEKRDAKGESGYTFVIRMVENE